MDEILKLGASELGGVSFDCSCGRRHLVGIKRIIVGKGVINEAIKIAGDFKDGKIFLIADNNTYKVCGSKVHKLLSGDGFSIKPYVFDTVDPLVPDEKAVGRLLIEADDGISLIIAVGSGTINDLARIISSRTKVPYVIVCTAPSMDGYASTVSPLIVEGFKTTYSAVYPYAIIADIDIMKEAPMEMIHAGFGDVLGKFTALADWELSRELNGEYYCKTSATLVRNALEICVNNAGKIAPRETSVIRYLTEALILTGIAIGLVGNSRPASGSEHLFAHYWEMDALAKGAKHPLHGNSVGVGTLISSMIYELLSEKLPVAIDVPKPEYIRKLLNTAGASDTPLLLGIDRELFLQSVLHTSEIRTRYTILNYAAEKNCIYDVATTLTGKFYG